MRIREPRFTVVISMTDGKKNYNSIYVDERPQEIMDRYKQILGDGNASVSVSTDVSLKTFGSGVSAMVTVSLTCGQDETNVNAAAELAAGAARYYAKKFQGEGEADLRAQLELQGRKVEF